MRTVHTTATGYVARQIEDRDPSLATLSINWNYDGSVRLDIPLSQYDMSNFLETHQKNQYAGKYCEIAAEAGYENMWIVDYSLFFQVVAALCNCYLHILNITNDSRDIYSCFTLRNVFRTSPFVDSEGFIERIKKFSLPLTMDENIVIPREPTENNMFFHAASVRNNKQTDYPVSFPHMFALPLVYRVFNSVGLVHDAETFAHDIEAWGFNKVNNNSAR